ncbi:MAG: GNAT family N-acetyltransferase [Acidimicrobiia bacterium]|nr:GNAT family N-acetyltransferase [Acidimicrobiia bacterium]
MIIDRDHILSLELIGHATWPALEEEWLNGWLLRASGGVTRRANSANPVHDLPINIEVQIQASEAWFEARQLPPVFRLTAAADPSIDLALDEAGYRRQPGALVMTRLLDDGPADATGGVEVADSASDAWLDLMAEEPGRGGDKREVARQILARITDPAGFASIGTDEAMQAIGLGVVHDSYLGVFMMQTAATHRRQGLARAVLAALMEWARPVGARQVFLQVHPENQPALALYGSLGFESQYEYWYRQPPPIV